MSYSYFAASATLLLSSLAVHAQTPAAQAPSTTRQEFEVASIKPNTGGMNMIMIRPPVGGRFTATNARLKMLIGLAYKVQNFQIAGGPAWANSDGFDVTAKAADSNTDLEKMRPMLQALLEDRFQLKVHRETKDVPVYALVPTKGGPKLPESKEGGCIKLDPNAPPPPPPGPGRAVQAGPGDGPKPAPGAGAPGPGRAMMAGPPPCGGVMMGPNMMQGSKLSMDQFTRALSNLLGRPVLDKTGFTGTFDVKLEYSPEGLDFGGLGAPTPPSGAPAFDTSGPSLFTAIQEQLGLKLESQKGPGELIVIDHAEKPSEN